MKSICYVTKFSYISGSEYIFLQKLSKNFDIVLQICNRNIFRNVIYLILLKIAFFSEKNINRLFRITRNFQTETFINVSATEFNCEIDLSKVDIFVSLIDGGLEFWHRDSHNVQNRKPNNLLKQIGRKNRDKDQIELSITLSKTSGIELLFKGKYEVDKLILNSQIISMKRILYYGVLYSHFL
jgi:hypothetical protein